MAEFHLAFQPVTDDSASWHLDHHTILGLNLCGFVFHTLWVLSPFHCLFCRFVGRFCDGGYIPTHKASLPQGGPGPEEEVHSWWFCCKQRWCPYILGFFFWGGAVFIVLISFMMIHLNRSGKSLECSVRLHSVGLCNQGFHPSLSDVEHCPKVWMVFCGPELKGRCIRLRWKSFLLTVGTCDSVQHLSDNLQGITPPSLGGELLADCHDGAAPLDKLSLWVHGWMKILS